VKLLSAVSLFALSGCPALLTDNFRIIQENSNDGSIDQTTLTQDGATDVASDASGVLDGSIADNSNDASVDAAGDGIANSEATIDAGCDAGVCSGSCVNLATDDSNCGACRYACVHGRHCAASRCTPVWLPMSDANAPAPVITPGAALGGKLIIAGGSAGPAPATSTAAAYDPNTDAWTPLPNLTDARCAHTLVSSGTYVYAFGGLMSCASGNIKLGSLEQWKPGDARWTIVAGANPPAPRYAHESAWTGSGVFVYGGSVGSAPCVATGAVYDPVQNIWSDAWCPLSGCERDNSPTIVDQGYIRLWGGSCGNADAGLQYEIEAGVWDAWTPSASFPVSLGNPADDGQRIYFPSGGGASNLDIVIFDRRQMQTRPPDTAMSPANMSAGGAIAWTGAEVVLWSGPNDAGVTSAGGRYQPPAP
jgi:hypothetical protein